MRLLLTTAAALLVLPLSAQAAQTWTGPYVGATLGYGIGNTVVDDQDCNISCSSQTFSPAGATYGATLGYNYQMGSTVLGVEADYNGINADEETRTDWPSHYVAEVNSYWTLRARAGLAVDRTLIFATAGVAGLNQHVEGDSTQTGQPANYHFNVDDTTVGAAMGAGLEWAYSGPLRAKIEYLHIVVPGKTNVRDDGANTWCSTHTYCAYGVKTGMDVVRVGVNYAF